MVAVVRITMEIPIVIFVGNRGVKVLSERM